MAAGTEVMGFVYFGLVKFAGYSIASVFFKKGYQHVSTPRVWIVGLARTGIGLAAGAIYGGLWLLGREFILGGLMSGMAEPLLYMLMLFPLRIAEWMLLIWIFFDRTLQRPKALKYSVLGTLASYALDAIGILAAFVIPGGFWIC